MNFISFDIELHDSIEEGENWDGQRVSVAALAFLTVLPSGARTKSLKYFYTGAGDPMSQKDLEQLAGVMDAITSIPDNLVVSWAGSSFDFKVLYELSRDDRYKVACLNHSDLFLEVLARRGFAPGLKKVLEAQQFGNKLTKVQLSDGSWIEDMGGAKAPELWRKGEKDAVLEYLKYDVEPLAEACEYWHRMPELGWVSSAGKFLSCKMELLKVNQVLELPVPNVSWMKEPPRFTVEAVTKWLGDK